MGAKKKKSGLPPGPVADVLLTVWRKMRLAEGRHPAWHTDAVHAAAIVGEEAGELLQAAIDFHFFKGSREAMRKEATDVTAMGLRFLLNMGELEPPGDLILSLRKLAAELKQLKKEELCR